jgi:transcriptional regulator GlxA family with amidase domain
MASQKTVGVLLFEGFELLDVFGPLEAWGMHAEIAGACTIVTAAEKAGAVKSAQGPHAMADYSLADCPRIDACWCRAVSARGARSKPLSCWIG